MRIDELDPTDASARHQWHEVMLAAVRADRPHALTTTLAAFEVSVTVPSEHERRTWLRAHVDDEVVGAAELELDPTVLDDARLLASEERLMRSHDVHVAAARRVADGVLGGYSLLLVPHGATCAWQDDTLVMPEHRGHRLGAALKAATYAQLPAEVTSVHTWTDPANTAMHRTNTAMGFRVVEHMYEMEARIAEVDASTESI